MDGRTRKPSRASPNFETYPILTKGRERSTSAARKVQIRHATSKNLTRDSTLKGLHCFLPWNSPTPSRPKTNGHKGRAPVIPPNMLRMICQGQGGLATCLQGSPLGRGGDLRGIDPPPIRQNPGVHFPCSIFVHVEQSQNPRREMCPETTPPLSSEQILATSQRPHVGDAGSFFRPSLSFRWLGVSCLSFQDLVGAPPKWWCPLWFPLKTTQKRVPSTENRSSRRLILFVTWSTACLLSHPHCRCGQDPSVCAL